MGSPDGTAVDIFNTFETSENQDLEDCHYVVTVAVMAASLLACLAAARKNMQGEPGESSRRQEEGSVRVANVKIPMLVLTLKFCF